MITLHERVPARDADDLDTAVDVALGNLQREFPRACADHVTAAYPDTRKGGWKVIVSL